MTDSTARLPVLATKSYAAALSASLPKPTVALPAPVAELRGKPESTLGLPKSILARPTNIQPGVSPLEFPMAPTGVQTGFIPMSRGSPSPTPSTGSPRFRGRSPIQSPPSSAIASPAPRQWGERDVYADDDEFFESMTEHSTPWSFAKAKEEQVRKDAELALELIRAQSPAMDPSKIKIITSREVGDTVKESIAEIVGLGRETFDQWEITDSIPEEQMYTIHYVQGTVDISSPLARIRGMVVHIPSRTILAKAFGYTPTAVVDKLTFDGEGNMSVVDEDGITHVINRDRDVRKMVYEGVLVRVMKINGKYLIFSHRSLDISRSRFGNSIPFGDMYKQLGGPPPETLFDSNAETSPFVHIFLVEHPALLIATKLNIGKGFVSYLGLFKMWSPEPADCPFRLTDEPPRGPEDTRPTTGSIEMIPTIPQTTDQIPDNPQQPMLVKPQVLSVEEANHHLRYGTYTKEDFETVKDERLLPGEPLMIYKYSPDTGEVVGLLKIQPQSYNWRTEIRGNNPANANRRNNPNLLYRFYELLDNAHGWIFGRNGDPASIQNYLDRFVLMAPFSSEGIKKENEDPEGGPVVVFSNLPKLDAAAYLSSIKQRQHQMWMNYIAALPLSYQLRVANFEALFEDNLTKLTNWMASLDGGVTLDGEMAKMITTTIKNARAEAEKTTSKVPVKQVPKGPKPFKGRGPKVHSVSDDVRANIHSILFNKSGVVLYKMIRDMKSFKEDLGSQMSETTETSGGPRRTPFKDTEGGILKGKEPERAETPETPEMGTMGLTSPRALMSPRPASEVSFSGSEQA